MMLEKKKEAHEGKKGANTKVRGQNNRERKRKKEADEAR